MNESLAPDVERANIRRLYLDVGWMSFAFAMEWYYLQVYAIHLGATALHLGILSSGRALLMVLGSALATRWQSQFSNAITALRLPTLSYRLVLYGGIALVPLLPARQVDILVVLVLLSAIPTGIAQGVFLGMLPTSVTKESLARIVSQRGVLMNAIVLGCVFFLGQFLTWLPQPVNYQIGFVLSVFFGYLSWTAMQHVKVPNTVKVSTQARAVNVWKFGPFRRFALVTFVLNTGVFMAGPLIPLQLVNGLNASDAWISVFGMIEMCAGALLTYFTPALIKRFGARKLIIVTTFATVGNVLVLALTPTLPPYSFGILIAGAGWFSVNVLLYNHLVETVPPEDMREYAATYQILINVSLFLGPLIGTFLIENVMSLTGALLFSAGLRAVAGILMVVIRIEPEKTPQIRPVEAVNVP